MATEIPYLTFEALKWIDDRMKQKRHDQVFLKDFKHQIDEKIDHKVNEAIDDLKNNNYNLPALLLALQWLTKQVNQDMAATNNGPRLQAEEIR